jgi:hypothetical protein
MKEYIELTPPKGGYEEVGLPEVLTTADLFQSIFGFIAGVCLFRLFLLSKGTVRKWLGRKWDWMELDEHLENMRRRR